jgi:hypothetical protein
VSGQFTFFSFDADGTDAENVTTHPYVVRPNDYSTGGVWKEQVPWAAATGTSIRTSGYATFAEAKAAAAGGILIVDSTVTISASTTTDVPIIRIPPGIFNIATGQTLTFNAGFSNPDNGQAFACTGTGKVAGLKEAYLDWFGSGSAALQLAFTASRNVKLIGEYTLTTNVVWPSDYGWSLTGNKGVSTIIAGADIVMLSPPDGDLGQYGTISGITFKSATAGTGTAIGKTASYIAHTIIKECDFQNSLRYGMNGILIECDIFHNQFGYPNASPATLFKAIKAVAVGVGYEINTNRIKYNEFINGTDDYVVQFEGGYKQTFDGNTFEQNRATASVVYTKDVELNEFLSNHFEQNGALPTFLLDQGATLNSLLNIFDGNLVNVSGQSTDCIIDITALTYKRLVMKGNIFAGQTHIIKNGAAFDERSTVVEWGNNHITGSANPFSPNSTNTDWGYAGSGIIGGNLSVGENVKGTSANSIFAAVNPTNTGVQYVGGNQTITLQDNQSITVTLAANCGAAVAAIADESGYGATFFVSYAAAIASLSDPSSRFVFTDSDEAKIAIFKSTNSYVFTIKNYANAAKSFTLNVLGMIASSTGP